MKIFEICFFKKDRSERVIKDVTSNSESEACSYALRNKKSILDRDDYDAFIEVTASFKEFISDRIFDNHSTINQMVDV